MAVSPGFRAFVVEQLGRVAPVMSRSMFGGLGIYSRGLFFAMVDNDTLYFKVDDSNRPDFEARGTGPFRPFPDPSYVMSYYEVPGDVIEDADALAPWVEKAIAVARAKKRGKATAKRRPARTRTPPRRKGK